MPIFYMKKVFFNLMFKFYVLLIDFLTGIRLYFNRKCNILHVMFKFCFVFIDVLEKNLHICLIKKDNISVWCPNFFFPCSIFSPKLASFLTEKGPFFSLMSKFCVILDYFLFGISIYFNGKWTILYLMFDLN